MTVWVVMEVRDWYPKVCSIHATEAGGHDWLTAQVAAGKIDAGELGEYRVEQWQVQQ